MNQLVMFWIVTAAMIAITTAQQLSTTACVCDSKSHSSAISFENTECEAPPKPRPTTKTVNYAVYTNQPSSEEIPGVVCSRWKTVRKVTTLFLP